LAMNAARRSTKQMDQLLEKELSLHQPGKVPPKVLVVVPDFANCTGIFTYFGERSPFEDVSPSWRRTGGNTDTGASCRLISKNGIWTINPHARNNQSADRLQWKDVPGASVTPVPKILHVTSPSLADCAGDYVLLDDAEIQAAAKVDSQRRWRLPEGSSSVMPLWKREGGARWLYLAPSSDSASSGGFWTIGDLSSGDPLSSNFISHPAPHQWLQPHELPAGLWKSFEHGQWRSDLNVSISVPKVGKSLSLLEEGDEAFDESSSSDRKAGMALQTAASANPALALTVNASRESPQGEGGTGLKASAICEEQWDRAADEIDDAVQKKQAWNVDRMEQVGIHLKINEGELLKDGEIQERVELGEIEGLRRALLILEKTDVFADYLAKWAFAQKRAKPTGKEGLGEPVEGFDGGALAGFSTQLESAIHDSSEAWNQARSQLDTIVASFRSAIERKGDLANAISARVRDKKVEQVNGVELAEVVKQQLGEKQKLDVDLEAIVTWLASLDAKIKEKGEALESRDIGQAGT